MKLNLVSSIFITSFDYVLNIKSIWVKKVVNSYMNDSLNVTCELCSDKHLSVLLYFELVLKMINQARPYGDNHLLLVKHHER